MCYVFYYSATRAATHRLGGGGGGGGGRLSPFLEGGYTDIQRSDRG